MLIRCGECNSNVSDQAAHCPKCGYPIKGAYRAQANDFREVQTIEQTGKVYKGLIVFFWVVILVVSPILFLSGLPGWGLASFIVGGMGEMFTKIGVWWDHG